VGVASLTRSIAAELLLLALDDQSGRPLLDSPRLHAALAGAALLDLTLDGVLELASPEYGRGSQLRRTEAPAPDDPLLAQIAEVADGKKQRTAVGALTGMTFNDRARKLKQQLLDRLAAEGVLTERRSRLIGLFPVTRWPQLDDRAEQAVRDRLRAVLVDEAEPDARTAALVGVLGAVNLVPKLLPDQDRKQLRRRVEQIAEGDWAGRAVKDSVEAVLSAVLTAAVVSGVVANGGG
jgi:Golgi phosphoprotein 3 (GPP34)